MGTTVEEAPAPGPPLVRPRDVRGVPLPAVAGEILARDVIADRNIPPFPRAAMDGFAVVWTGRETERPYRVGGSVNPGTAGGGVPTETALLAGHDGGASPVYEHPTVAALSPGDELVEPWEVASGPMIRNSNAHFLLAALNGLGFRKVRYLGIVKDERETITAKIP